MECLCCKEQLTQQTTKFWRRLLLCKNCEPLAVKAEQELNAAHARAKAQSLIWLEQYVMSGSVLRGLRYALPAGQFEREADGREGARGDVPEVQDEDLGKNT